MSKSKAIVKKQRPGIHTWLRTGRVNPSIRGHKELQRYLMSLERELTELQGPGGMTAGREILIKSTVEAFGAVLLAGMYCKRAGILRPDMARRGVIEFQPVLGKQFLSFMNTIRQNLMALGLDSKKADGVCDLADYIKVKDSETKSRKGGAEAAAGQAEAVKGSDQEMADHPFVDPGAPGGDISGQAQGGIDCGAEGSQDQGREDGQIGQRGAPNEVQDRDDAVREWNRNRLGIEIGHASASRPALEVVTVSTCRMDEQRPGGPGVAADDRAGQDKGQ